MASKHIDTNIAIPNTSTGLVDAIYGVLSQYTNIFTHENGSNILTLEDNYQINFDYTTIGLKVNDTVYYNVTCAFDRGYGPATFTTLVGKTFCYTILQWSRWGDPRRLYLLFLFGDDRRFLLFNQDARYYNVDGTGTHCYAIDLNSKYDNTFHSRTIVSTSKSPASPYAIFANAAVFSNLSGDYFVMDELKSCSRVTTLTEVTINNKTYFPIGTSTIIEVDS